MVVASPSQLLRVAFCAALCLACPAEDGSRENPPLGVWPRGNLVSVDVFDESGAVVLAETGEIYLTRDQGSSWRAVSAKEAEGVDSDTGLAGFSCDPEAKGHCWSVAAGVRRTTDGGETWQFVPVEDFARIDPVVFGFGRVEVVDAERVRLNGFIARNRHRRGLTWSLEPGISPSELEQIGRRRDPEALFALIDARLQELRSMIEESVQWGDRVVELAEPPWDFADYLDDDPEILERYWSAHAASQPNVIVQVAAPLHLTALRVGASQIGIAVGEGGALVRSEDGGAHWMRIRPISPHDLLDVGFGSRRIVIVGAQGALWGSANDGLSWQRPPGRGGAATFFDALRSVSFSPSGSFGLIVGEQGRVLRSLDGGVEWDALASELSLEGGGRDLSTH